VSSPFAEANLTSLQLLIASHLAAKQRHHTVSSRRIGGLAAISRELMSRRKLSRVSTAIADALSLARIDLDQAFDEFPGIKSMDYRIVRRRSPTMDTVGWITSIVASLVEFSQAAISRES
jgi:hypothetical protein